MKKKGLIIATIVMVLVLAVSLTTATYAWFTNTGTASITAINFSVGASSSIVIGVSETNAYVSTDVTQADFWSGSTTFDGSVWTGDVNALGTQVNTGLDLSSLSGAVYSFSSVTGTSPNYTAVTMDSYSVPGSPSVAANTSQAYAVTGINPSHNVLVGQGTGAGSNYTVDSLADAVPNSTTTASVTTSGDYLNIALGSAPGKNDVLAYGLMVYIAPTTTAKTILGLNAAIHVAYSKNGAAFVDYDVYGGSNYNTVKSDMTAPTLPSVTIDTTTKSYTSANVTTPQKGDAYIFIPIQTAADSTHPLSTGTIDQIQLIIYLCGPDADCLTTGNGVGATVYIEYLSINTTQFAAP